MGLRTLPGVPRPPYYPSMDTANRRTNEQGSVDIFASSDAGDSPPAENWVNAAVTEVEPAASAAFSIDSEVENVELYDVLISFSRTSDELATYTLRVTGGAAIITGTNWDGTSVSAGTILSGKILTDGGLTLEIQRTSGGTPATRITGELRIKGFQL